MIWVLFVYLQWKSPSFITYYKFTKHDLDKLGFSEKSSDTGGGATETVTRVENLKESLKKQAEWYFGTFYHNS